MKKDGIASANAAANIRRSRTDRGWSLAELSARLGEIGHPMGVGVLSKLELGDRGIDVDDLAAISVVLGEPPARLLLDSRMAAMTELANLVEDLRDTYAERFRRVEELDARITELQERIWNLTNCDPEVEAMLEATLKLYVKPRAAKVLMEDILGDEH